MVQRVQSDNSDDLLPEIVAKIRLLIIETQTNSPLLLTVLRALHICDSTSWLRRGGEHPFQAITTRNLVDILSIRIQPLVPTQDLTHWSVRDLVLVLADQCGGVHEDLVGNRRLRTIGFSTFHNPMVRSIVIGLAQLILEVGRTVFENISSAQIAEADYAFRLPTLERLVSQQPNNVDLRLDRAALHGLHDNYAKARRDIEKALELNPTHPMARLMLATIEGRAGRKDEARKIVENLRVDHLEDVFQALSVARIAVMSGYFECAVICLEAAAQMTLPGSITVHLDPAFDILRNSEEYKARLERAERRLGTGALSP